MGKLCIIAYSPKSIAPYLNKYIELLDSWNIKYDYITRELRDNIIDKYNKENNIVIYYDTENSIVGKLMRVLKWRREVLQILKNEQYDKLIILTGYPAIILCDYLRKEYKYQYILDIRDYIPIFKCKLFMKVLKNVIYGSYLTVISSKGFLKWLPTKEKVMPTHNLPSNPVEIHVKKSFVSKDKIRIGYLGVVNYYHQNIKLIEALKNESRYSLLYGGIFPKENNIKSYCEQRGINSVEFIGKFSNDEKVKIYQDIDIINAVYGNDSLIVTTALPNKLYDAILYKKPIMVSKGTYLSEVVEEYHIGFSIDLDNDNVVDKLDKFVKDFDESEFYSNCRRLLELCLKEESIIIEKIRSFVRE